MKKKANLSQFETLKLITIFLVVLVMAMMSFPKIAYGATRNPAAINRAAIAMATPSKILNISKEISPELLYTYQKLKAEQKPFDVSQVLPSDLTPTNDSNLVFSKIADRSLSSFFNSEQLRATPIGRTATQVEQKMKQDISIKANKIEHKFTFQIQAFQTIAKIDYRGLTNASLKYQASNSTMGLEVFDRLPRTKNKDLVISHVANNTERISSLSVRWGF
jgi:hypothetical protein